MKLKVIGIAVLITTANLLSAQSGKIEYELGDSYRFPRKHEDLGFLGSESEGLVQIGLKARKKLTVMPVNSKDYSVETPVSINLKEIDRRVNNVGFIHLQNNYYWFYSVWDKEREKEQLYVRPFDVRNSRFSSEDKKIIQTNELTNGSYIIVGTHLVGIDKYNFQTSADGSKLLIKYRLASKAKKDEPRKDVIGFCVFDQNMKQLWNREIEMPYTTKEMEGLDCDVDSDGNVYMVAKVFDPLEEGSEKSKKEQMKNRPSHFEVFNLHANSKQLEIVKLSLDKKYARGNPIFADDNNGNLICTGFYSNDQSHGMDGIFVFKMDPKSGSLSSYGKGYYEIPNKVLMQSEGGRRQKKIEQVDEKEYDAKEQNLVFRKIQFNKDGSLLVIGEEYYEVEVYHYDPKGGSYTTIDFHYNDIMVFSINADGNLAWVNKIPKRQKGIRGRGGMSFYHITIHGKECFVFLDNKKNIDLGDDEAPAVHRDQMGGFLTCVSIDKDGKIEKQNLFDSRKLHVNVLPANFQRVSDSKVAARVIVKKRKGKILTLDFK